MKQTAVEWLELQLKEIRFISYAANCPIERGKLKEYLKQAKAMEKEQIMDAYNQGCNDYDELGYKKIEQYYNETFKSE